MSIENPFTSPSSGRKTSNFFPSNNDAVGPGSSVMGLLDRAGGSTRAMEAIGAMSTPGMGSFGTVSVGMDAGGDMGPGIDLGRLVISGGGPVHRPHSIWSDSNKNGTLFSPFVSRSLTEEPRFAEPGFAELGVVERLEERREEPPPPVQHAPPSTDAARENIYSSKVDKPTFVPGTPTVSPKNTERPKQHKVSLPATARQARGKQRFHDHFLRQENDANNEDYCSTFYKRNRLGYMFIREPSSTLRVNSSGNKSWVQLKVKFPHATSSRKLKVDIKHLPFWKPINMNVKDPSRGKKISKDKRKSSSSRSAVRSSI